MEVRLIDKIPSMGTRSIRNGSNPEQPGEALGTVWILCPYPVVARGLEGALKGKARVYLGPEPPGGSRTPSAVIFCPDEAAEAGRLAEKLEIHYTPKHGS